MNQPIGIFDSGTGGLTVAGGITRFFSQESVVYLGDTAHFPYGEKSTEAIRGYSQGITEFLLGLGCKMIVIACNSASSAAYHQLQQQFSQYPIIDVISPLVQSIATRPFKKVGVIATKATIRSGVYTEQLKVLRPDLQVVAMATPLLAPVIEEGFTGTDISRAVIRQYLSNPEFRDIDALLLACTHYPLIRKEIEDFFEGRVQVFDSVDSVVERVGELLHSGTLAADANNQPTHRFFVSDYTDSFEQTTAIFYQQKVRLELAKWHKNEQEEKVLMGASW